MAPRRKGSEYLWGYGSGVAATTTPDYGDVVPSSTTRTFNQADVSYYYALYLRTVVTLDRFPIHVTADAAFDSWYVYETVAHRGGIAAIPLGYPWARGGASRPRRDPLLLGRPAHASHLCVCPHQWLISLNAFAVRCSFPPAQARAVSTSNLPKARAASKTSTSRPVG